MNQNDFVSEIQEGLFSLQDEKYRSFLAKLMPEIEFDRIIGVRTPELRKYAREVAKKSYAGDFLQQLPHTYYEENNLHGALLSLLYKDVDVLLDKVEAFLPYVDNWATCDMISPKAFKRNLPLVYERIRKWIAGEHTYMVRFAIVTLLGFYLDEAFMPEQLALVAGVKSEEYYIRMAVAWYFSTALVKQYDKTIPYFTKPVLDAWTHNKAIQKAVESRRIPDNIKTYIRTLRV